MANNTSEEQRARWEAAIKNGGSVLHGEKLYTRIEELPSKAEMAKGDPEAEAVAREDLKAQIAALQAQVDGLTPADDAKGGKKKNEAGAQTPPAGGDTPPAGGGNTPPGETDPKTDPKDNK